jgi:glutathione reductase (NADPH)
MEHRMRTMTHDLIVIGTGTAANVTAFGCRKAGWSVAVIDHRPFGGTCALRGCDPKKMLIAATEVIDGFERMGGIGTVQGELRIDWAALQRHKRSFTDPVPGKREQAYARQGIDTYRGRARFTGSNTVVVDETTLMARHVVIAAGAEPARLPIEGFEHLALSDYFLELDSLPHRIALVGGGYIGFEFAHIAARAGAKVTILNRGPRPLAGFEPELVELLLERTRALGVDVRLGHEVKAVRRTGTGFEVEAECPGGRVVIETDLAIHSGGRRPALDALDLDVAGIAHDEGSLRLDGHFRSTSNPAVYAAGDAAGGPLRLTPVAALEAHAVVDNLLGNKAATVDYTGIPSAVFTLPVLARVGLLEAEARAQGLHFKVKHEQVPGWFTARRVNEPCYGYKVLVEEGSGRILGAHLIGPEAGEAINLFGFAMRSGLTAEAIRHATFAYPTAASDIESMLPSAR